MTRIGCMRSGRPLDRQSCPNSLSNRSMGKLDGKTVLITGASRGIGLAIAQAFDREGAKLILVARNRGPLARSAERLSGTVLSHARGCHQTR